MILSPTQWVIPCWWVSHSSSVYPSHNQHFLNDSIGPPLWCINIPVWRSRQSWTPAQNRPERKSHILPSNIWCLICQTCINRPNRDELSFLMVLAFPKASKMVFASSICCCTQVDMLAVTLKFYLSVLTNVGGGRDKLQLHIPAIIHPTVNHINPTNPTLFSHI